MINRNVDFSVENKFIVLVLVPAACVAGWWSLSDLPLDAIPDLSDTQVIIYSRWDRSPDSRGSFVGRPFQAVMSDRK